LGGVLAVASVVLTSFGAGAASPSPSTWVQLRPLPNQGQSAIFALDVDPAANQHLVAGNAQGALLRSTDGGASWSTVHTGRSVAATVDFSPYQSALVLVGTLGGGALISRDDGLTWTPAAGLQGRSVRAFGFALNLIVAATDHGVYVSSDGASWRQSGLVSRSITTIAVEAIHAPVRLLVAGEPVAGEGLQLFQSLDGAASWTGVGATVSGSRVVKLNAGPLPPTGIVRPLLVGTNAGLFASGDNGATFRPLSGGELLPSTDYTQLSFIKDHYNRFYAASDGGGSSGGGLWRTNDGGRTFLSLAPPVASVTAMAVSNDEAPYLYVATFTPADHAAALWVYHDTSGTPQGPPVTPSASGTRTSPLPSEPGGFSLSALLSSSQAPYLALGVAALVVIVLAAVSHLRGRRR
jgi:photosystem II stability/assembly factor-like uncharacterized protein